MRKYLRHIMESYNLDEYAVSNTVMEKVYKQELKILPFQAKVV